MEIKLKCPICSSEMVRGKFKLKGTFWGFLLFGMSQKELYFLSDENNEKELTLGLSDTKNGYLCYYCHTQLILNENTTGQIISI